MSVVRPRPKPLSSQRAYLTPYGIMMLPALVVCAITQCPAMFQQCPPTHDILPTGLIGGQKLYRFVHFYDDFDT